MAYTYNTPSSIGNITIVGTGSSYTSGTVTLNSPWATTASPYVTVAGSNGTSAGGALTVTGDAEFKGKVKINGQDLAETLEIIKDRLAILIPDPKLLDKYEALRQAYEHYKTLEALCVEQSNPNEQS